MSLSQVARLNQQNAALARQPDSRPGRFVADRAGAAADAAAGAQPLNVKLTALTTAAVAVASLPSAASSAWQRRFVNDALAPAFGSPVTNGGAATVPVFSDGTLWVVG